MDQTSFNRRSNKEIASFSKPTVTFKDEMNPATLSLEPSFDASQDIKSKSKKFRKKIRKLEKDEKFLTEKQKKELRKYRIRAQKNIEAAEERASQKLVAYEKSVKVQDFYRAKLRELKEKKKQSLQYRLKKVAEQVRIPNPHFVLLHPLFFLAAVS